MLKICRIVQYIFRSIGTYNLWFHYYFRSVCIILVDRSFNIVNKPHRILKNLGLLLFVIALSVLSASIVAQQPFICEGQLFLTVEEESQRLIRIEIDPFTQEIEFLTINNQVGGTINAIGYRKTDNLIYGVNPLSDGQYGHYLERLDATGQIEFLTKLPLTPDFGYFAGDITPDGRFLILIGVDRMGRLASDFVTVDLTTPGYTTNTSKMDGSYNIFDIAFDPLTSKLYAYESGGAELLVLDPTNGNILQRIKSNNVVNEIAGLFFDAFGQLFGYGGTGKNNTLLKIDKNTGFISLLVSGPAVDNADATACPFTIEMIKKVNTTQTVPCTELIYTFAIANGSGELQQNIQFEDFFPANFTIKEVIRNPYVGDLLISPEGNRLTINNMQIPPGVDSVVVVVEVNDSKDGIYPNQAILRGLPAELGDFRVSDNPATLTEDDSTVVQIIGSPIPDTLDIEYHICNGDGLLLDGTIYGDRYAWSTGSQEPIITVQEAGTFLLTADRTCDRNVIRYLVSSDFISVELPSDPIEIRLGESYRAHPILTNSQEFFSSNWLVVDTSEVKCPACLSSEITPRTNDLFFLTVRNAAGCTDTAQIRFRIDRTRRVYVPNVFTPNADGTNDWFFVQSPDFGLIHRMQVFNRWGDIVFDSKGPMALNDSRAGWNGTLRGKALDPAVFVYVIDIEYLDGVRDIISGDVTLLR